jgi:hypothetical protein
MNTRSGLARRIMTLEEGMRKSQTVPLTVVWVDDNGTPWLTITVPSPAEQAVDTTHIAHQEKADAGE